MILLFVLSICGCGRSPELALSGYSGEEEHAAPSEAAEAAALTGGEAVAFEDEVREELLSVGEDGSPVSETGEEAQPETAIQVYVCGAVRAPGVYGLPEAARIYEAVDAAGGFRKDADREWLNLAGILQDGEKLKIFTKEETAQFQEAAASGAVSVPAEGFAGSPWAEPGANAGDRLAGGGDGKVNLNTATREELMTLPGIGAVKADAVIAYRSEHGGFGAIEDIMRISGIKGAVFEKIKEKIAV